MRPGWRAWAPVATLGVIVLLVGRASLRGAAAQDDDDTGVLDTELVDTDAPAAPSPPMLDLPPLGPDLQPYLPGTRAADHGIPVVEAAVDTDRIGDTEVSDTRVRDTDVSETDTEVDTDTALGALRLLSLTVDGVPIDSGTPVTLEIETPTGVRVRELRVLPP